MSEKQNNQEIKRVGTADRKKYWSGFVKDNSENPSVIVERLKNLESQAFTDSLTDLLNKKGFEYWKPSFLENAKRRDEKIIVFFLDLDKLKETNDKLGHEEGDKLIINTANSLKKTFRKTDLVTRLGGDEFVVLTSVDLKQPDSYQKVTEDILTRLFTELGDIEVSCGLDLAESEKDIEQLLLERADKRMYVDKSRFVKKQSNG